MSEDTKVGQMMYFYKSDEQAENMPAVIRDESHCIVNAN